MTTHSILIGYKHPCLSGTIGEALENRSTSDCYDSYDLYITIRTIRITGIIVDGLGCLFLHDLMYLKDWEERHGGKHNCRITSYFRRLTI